MRELDPLFYRTSIFLRKREKWICVALIVLCAIVLSLMLFGCAESPVLGPSDTAIQDAQAYADSLPDNDPQKEAAVANANRLKESRKAADERVSGLGAMLNYVAPGAGILLAAAYAAIQKVRRNKERGALASTILGIEQFKMAGGIDAASKLLTTLSKQHDDDGVRDTVRAIRSTVKK